MPTPVSRTRMTHCFVATFARMWRISRRFPRSGERGYGFEIISSLLFVSSCLCVRSLSNQAGWRTFAFVSASTICFKSLSPPSNTG